MAAENNKQNETSDATRATGTSGIAGDPKAAGSTSPGSTDSSATGGIGSAGFSSTGSSTSGSSTSSFGTSSTTSGSSSTTGGTGGGSATGGGSQSGQGSTGSETTDKIASSVGDVLRGDTSTATGTARSIVSQVKESGGKVASEALGTVKEKATTAIEEQKATLAQSLGGVAETIRKVGGNLQSETGGENNVASTVAKYGDSLAGQVEQFSDYLEKHNVSDMLREVERFARRNPAYFIGGAFLLGLLGARFLKSSNPNQALMAYEGGENSGSDEEIFHRRTGVKGSGEGIRPV